MATTTTPTPRNRPAFPQMRPERVAVKLKASDYSNVVNLPAERRIKMVVTDPVPPLLSARLNNRRLPGGEVAVYFQTSSIDEPAIDAMPIEALPQVTNGRWHKPGGKSGDEEHRVRLTSADDQPILEAEFFRVNSSSWRFVLVKEPVNEDDHSLLEAVDVIMSSPSESPVQGHRYFQTLTAGTQSTGNTTSTLGDAAYKNLLVHGILEVLSDENSKTDIRRMEGMVSLMDRFMRIDVATFRDMHSQRRLGLLAQNWFELFPETVHNAEIDSKVYKTLDMTGVNGIMVLAIQEMWKMFVSCRDEMTLSKSRRFQDVDKDTESQSEGSITLGLVEQAATEICQDLNEPNVQSVHDVVLKYGVDLGLKMKDEVLANPPENGRTPGGVWFKLMKVASKSGRGEPLHSLSSESVRDHIRPYQVEAVSAIGSKDSILVLPTGFGKTLVSIIVMEKALAERPDSAAIFVCQQRSLAGQQPEFLFRDGPSEWREKDAILLYYGGGVIQTVDGDKKTLANWKGTSGKPEQLTRSNFVQILNMCKVLVVTAGALKDMLLTENNHLDLARLSIVVLDEAHHAGEGDHPMVQVARYLSEHSRAQLLGLSASPISGSTDLATLHMKLRRLTSNMRHATMVVPRVESSIIDPQPERAYPSLREIEIMRELCDLAKHLETECFAASHNPPKQESYGFRYIGWATTEALNARKSGDIHRAALCHGLREVVKSVLLCRDIGPVCAKSLLPCLVDIENDFEGADLVRDMLAEKIIGGILKDAGLGSADFVATKLKVLEGILRKQEPSSRTLIRVATKRGVTWLTNYLYLKDFRVGAMLGRTDMTDVTSKMALEQFKQGKIDVLVTTSVIEEGIDLQSCDLVIAYSVKGIVVSGKALIQNAGRARKTDSRMVVLVSNQEEEWELEEMRDQIRQMKRVLQRVRDDI